MSYYPRALEYQPSFLISCGYDHDIHIYDPFIDGNCIKESSGEIQLTDYGISGICVFNLSSPASIALHENKEVRVKINFFEDDFYEFMEKNTLNLNLEETLESLFNYKLMHIFFKLSKINKDKYWCDLSESDKKSLANVINEFNIKTVKRREF